jgi:tetratricopeptide (TPR) repeat protein/DNA-binding CsgD family transcriptional regulator
MTEQIYLFFYEIQGDMMTTQDMNSPSDAPDELLTTLNAIKFTSREIDIITLIFHTRGSSKIAGFLSISTRTVETHTANIMRKMDAHSREGIIDFVEKSGQVPWVQKHYQNLLEQIDFKKQLREISRLIQGRTFRCSLIVGSEQNEAAHFASTLKEYLTLSGVKTVLRKNNDEAPQFGVSENLPSGDHILYILPKILVDKFQMDKEGFSVDISNLAEKNASTPMTFIFLQGSNNHVSQEFLAQNCCIFFGNHHQEYYFSFFSVLKRILPELKLDKVITSFKGKHEQNTGTTPPATVPLSLWSSLKKGLILKNQARLFAFISIFLLISSLWGVFIFQYCGDCGEKKLMPPIRSDLVVPTDHTSLGRSYVISKIEENLKGSRGIQTIALVGIGGAGKTTIARKYARQQNANIIWEINAATREGLRNSFERLADALCQSEEEKTILAGLQNIKNNLEQDHKILLFVKERMKKLSNWFLIYDNVEKFSDIHKHFPYDSKGWGNGKVIITTSNGNTKNNNFINKFIQIGELSPQEKLDLFVSIMNHEGAEEFTLDQKEKASAFLAELPPYPLDISIAAYYLQSTNTPYKEYLDRLKENSKDFDIIQADVVKEASGYTKTRYGIITLSVKELITIHKDFQDLLLLVSSIGYQNIPKCLLAHYKGDAVADNFIYHLKKYSLVTNESFSSSTPTISIHKKTQEIVLSYLINALESADRRPFLQAMAMRVEAYVLDAVDKEDFSRMKLLAPHLEILLNRDNLLSEATRASLKGALGCIYYYLKHYPKIKQFLEENLVDLKRHYGEKHNKIARILVYLGNFYRSLGDYERAKTLLEQSLDICKESPDDLRRAKAFGYLGAVYRDLGEYKKARDFFEKSLVIYEEQTPNSIGHAWILAHSGNIRLILGDYEKAKELLEQSFTIYKKQSEDYVGAAWVLGYLGTVHRLLGDCKTAKALVEKALFITRKYFSNDHIYVASHISTLANIYIAIGDYETAKTLLKENLNFYLKNYGQDHIWTANVLRMLGEAYCLEGNLETSEELINRSLLICQQKNKLASFEPLESLAGLYLKKAAQAINEGDAKQAQNFKNRAIHYLKQSLQMIKDCFSEDSPHATRIQLKLDGLSKQAKA